MATTAAFTHSLAQFLQHVALLGMTLLEKSFNFIIGNQSELIFAVVSLMANIYNLCQWKFLYNMSLSVNFSYDAALLKH